jgi:2-oxoglutarate ferredoxin oxidoreductase subunit gamma
MDKFASRVKAGGLLLYESSNILQPITRTDIQLIGINATTEALLLKNVKIMNMIILGAYLQMKPVVKIESISEALKKVLPEKYHHLLPINKQALEKGAALFKAMKEPIM